MAGTLKPWPLTRQGAKDHPVFTLQHLLRAHGHTVAIDGVFGAQTAAAVTAYQRAKGLNDDGIVGPKAWRAVIIETRRGAQGDAARAVQEELRYRGQAGEPGAGLVVDGYFGPRTEAAVRGFQQAVGDEVPGLAIDGVVGPRTWQALVAGMLAG